jgi:hypothetical protein
VITTSGKTPRGEQILIQTLTPNIYRVMIWVRDGSVYFGPVRDNLEAVSKDAAFHRASDCEYTEAFKAAYAALTDPSYPVKNDAQF